ncbi:glycosyltransferase family 4 protein [Segnochrobactrum spirostomi]|uniref:glycosyltransferase family 4 protein n=1 Tax=Segnochrobactrum spirostomi TaxID=2608987 RepID=UPI0028AE11F3|nr:glycosyltransferase family 1 protein [Segnochrobactrum spirostomi]
MPKNPFLRQIALYDDGAPSNPGVIGLISNAIATVLADPFGSVPSAVPDTSIVAPANRSSDRRVSAAYLMKDAYGRASEHFRRYGSRLSLRVESRPALAHFTYPIPMRVRGAPNIYTIHDLVPLMYPSLTADDKRYYYNMVKDICKRGDHIVTVSDASRYDIMRIFGVNESRITNTYQSISIPPTVKSKDDRQVANELEGLFGLDWRGYFLFVGAIEPKKNILRLIEAYLAANVSQPLVLVGAPGWAGEKERALADDPRFGYYSYQQDIITPRRQIKRLEYVSRPHLFSLMRGARALLFPSIYEGFGLPVLEAMSLGTPVLSSNTGSIPEVAGNAALLVDPFNVDSISNGIKSLSHDDDLCSHLAYSGYVQAARFSNETYMEKISDIYSSFL